MRFQTYAVTRFTIIWSPIPIPNVIMIVLLAKYTAIITQENDITNFTICLNFFFQKFLYLVKSKTRKRINQCKYFHYMVLGLQTVKRNNSLATRYTDRFAVE